MGESIKVLSNPNECATIGQANIMREYLLERRRALRQELANIERILGIEPKKGAR